MINHLPPPLFPDVLVAAFASIHLESRVIALARVIACVWSPEEQMRKERQFPIIQSDVRKVQRFWERKWDVLRLLWENRCSCCGSIIQLAVATVARGTIEVNKNKNQGWKFSIEHNDLTHRFGQWQEEWLLAFFFSPRPRPTSSLTTVAVNRWSQVWTFSFERPNWNILHNKSREFSGSLSLDGVYTLLEERPFSDLAPQDRDICQVEKFNQRSHFIKKCKEWMCVRTVRLPQPWGILFRRYLLLLFLQAF